MIWRYGGFTEYEGKDSDEVYFMYAHLSEVLVTLNQEITIGDFKTKILGKTGNTGASGTKGQHLHLEIATVMNAIGTDKTKRTSPRFIKLNSYNTSDQDDAANYKYKQDRTKARWPPQTRSKKSINF